MRLYTCIERGTPSYINWLMKYILKHVKIFFIAKATSLNTTLAAGR